MSRLRICVTTLLAAVACESCGASDDSADASQSSLPADLKINVTGNPDTELCFEAAIDSLDVTFERRCYPPPHEQVIAYAGSALIASDDPMVNSASLLVTPYPLRVTSVEQRGADVPWQQDGGGIVLIGRFVPNADTTIEFKLGGKRGKCEWTPDRESCRGG